MKEKNYFVGVDIGGTKTYIAIEDKRNEPVLLRYYLTASVKDNLADQIRKCLREAGVSEDEVAAAGMGIPGRVDRGVVIDAPGLAWKEYPLAKELEQTLPFPVYLNNDVRMALIGEKHRAGREEVRDMVFIAVGTGLGCAFMADNAIVTGKDNSAGEIGYFICQQDVEEGLENPEGAFGTMENYVSGNALGKAAAKIDLSAEELFTACKEPGNPAKDIVDSFLSDLAVLISNVVSLLDPELVVIGGGVSDSLSRYVPKLNAAVSRFTPLKTEVALSKLGNKAGVLGACEYGKRCYEKEQKLQERRLFVYEPHSFQA